jgi:mannobiose 2-epimerase
MELSVLEEFKNEVISELKGNILTFWMNEVMDSENGGYYGKITNDLQIEKEADKGCILNSRILWTYSCAYRLFKDDSYLKAAGYAYEFMMKYFWDKEYSGLYWSVDFKGKAIDKKKQIYNIAFGIYGLSEYYRATGCEESLEKAMELHRVLERYSYDDENKGYGEAYTREWKDIQDMRLSNKDLNSKKSMNTHLHILEAYTNLFRVWKDEGLKKKLSELINVTMEYIISKDTYQFKLFFDEKWNSLSGKISYGHDIEGSWLLYEAAEVLGEHNIIEKAKKFSINMAKKVCEDGLDREFGGLFYERHENGSADEVKAWWPQAEAVVGFFNAYQLTGDKKYAIEAYNIWKYIDKNFIDKEFGEWFNELSKDGKVDNKMPKVSSWKCPYHNSRACFEIMERIRVIGGEVEWIR